MRGLAILILFLFAGIGAGVQAGEIEFLSRSHILWDQGGDADSGAPAISADGRVIVFGSAAANLVDRIIKQPVSDIFLHDRQSELTRLISLSTNGTTGADNDCWNPQISADGNTVIFETASANLVTTPRNGASGVLVYDVAARTLLQATLGFNGTAASDHCRNALLSADGRTLVFESAAINLTTGVVYRTSETPHIFARDLQAGKTELINVNYRNREPARSLMPSFSSIVGVSSNGSSVAFLSNGSNLVEVFPQSYRSNNLWIRDRTLGTNILVSGISNQPSLLAIVSPSMSADGTKFVFSNGRTNFFRDLSQPSAVPIKVPTNALAMTISPDGELVAFFNRTRKLSVGRVRDTTFIELPPEFFETNVVFSADSSTLLVKTYQQSFESGISISDRTLKVKTAQSHLSPAVNHDGSVVATDWSTPTNAYQNVFVEENGSVVLVSKGPTTNVASPEPTQGPREVSSDGRFLLYTSYASLVSEDQNKSQDVFLWDRLERTNHLVSRALEGGSGSAASFMPSMTPDAQYVVFASAATNLVSNDTNRSNDIFVWNRSDSSIRLVSATVEQPVSAFPVTLACSWPIISKDGRYAAFVSRRRDLVPGVMRTDGIYLRDLENNVTIPAFPTNLTSSTWARTVAILDGPVVYYFERTHLFSFDARDKTVRIFTNCVVDPSFSTDEKRVALLSHLAGNVTLDVFETATAERHSIYQYPAALPPGLEHSISLSGDGKRVAFVTPERLTNNDRNGTNDVYVAEVDRPAQFRLANPDHARAALAVRSAYPSLSEDGRRVTFLSKGNNWVPRSMRLEPRIYMVDLPLRRSEHVTFDHAKNPYFSTGYSPPLIMPNGGAVAYGTTEAFLIDDSNASPDAYVASFSMLPMTDLDKDELPDDWEITEFGDLLEDADGDSDGDGHSNRFEYVAGTDPVLIDSVLKIEISETTTESLQLRWATVPGKSYEVQFKANLEDDWDLLSQNYAVSNGIAELSLEANQEAGFFRIQVNE